MITNKNKKDEQQAETFDQKIETFLNEEQEQEALQVLANELKNTSERVQQWQNVMALLGAQLKHEEEEKTKAEEEAAQQEDAPYRALAKSLNKQR